MKRETGTKWTHMKMGVNFRFQKLWGFENMWTSFGFLRSTLDTWS